jgi:hypothetical protein
MQLKRFVVRLSLLQHSMVIMEREDENDDLN